MTDIVTPAKRREMMAGIRSKNTRMEISIRKALFALGFRYKIHEHKLPGNPDIILPKFNAVIFVNGCFWHCHNCHLFKWPNSRKEFWRNKLNKNKKNDNSNQRKLANLKWRILVVWECAFKGKERIDFESLIHEIDHWIKSDQELKTIRGHK